MHILLDTGFLVALIVKPHNQKQNEQHETAKQMLKTHGADFADVALVFLAARLKTTHIFTVDKADFSMYRTRTGKPFNCLWVND